MRRRRPRTPRRPPSALRRALRSRLWPGRSRRTRAALGHARHGRDLAGLVFSPQRLRHRRLLLARQQPWVGARVFFTVSGGRLARVGLEPHLPEPHLCLSRHVPQHLYVAWQVVESLARGNAFLLGVPGIIAHCLPTPYAGRRARRAVPGGDLRGGSVAGPELGHRLYPLPGRDRTRLRVRPPAFPLPGGELVDPIAEVLPAGGIAHLAHGPGEALSVREVVAHGSPPHPQGEPGLPLPLRGSDLPMPQIVPVPGPGRMPRRVAELGNGVRRAQVELGVGLDCQLALLCAVHAVLRVTYSWSRITTAVPLRPAGDGRGRPRRARGARGGPPRRVAGRRLAEVPGPLLPQRLRRRPEAPEGRPAVGDDRDARLPHARGGGGEARPDPGRLRRGARGRASASAPASTTR